MAVRRVAAAGLVGLALAACGIKGRPPQPGEPKPVSDLRVEGRDGAVRVSWKGRTAAGVRGFDVLRRRESEERTYFERLGDVKPAGSRRYEFYDRSPVPGATYVYRVRPRRDDPPASEMRYTGPQSTFTWTEAPGAPTGVKSAPLNEGARLSWDPVPGADGYRVYQLDAAKVANAEPANRGLIDKTSWVAVALPTGKPICYVVRAVTLPERLAEARDANVLAPVDDVEAPSAAEVGDAAMQGIVIPRTNVGKEIQREVSELIGEGPLPGVESPSSDATCVIPGLTEPPPAPKRLSAAIVSEGISLSWHPSPGEEVVGYHVERRELGPDGTPKGMWSRMTSAPVNAVGYVDREARKGTSYQYQVRAVDAAGAEGPPSTPTPAVTFRP